MGMSTRTILAADGARLAYRAFAAAHGTEGDVPVVLLHATLSASAQLAGLGRLLAARGPVFALDRRGSGESAVPAPQLVDAEGLGAAILVGHSFGAIVALEAAWRIPERVIAVVAWEPPYGPLADEETRAGFAAVAAATARAHAAGGAPAAAEAFLDGVSGEGSWQALSARARAFIAAQGDGAFADAGLAGLDPAGLTRIAAPVTILAGTASEAFYAPIARAVVDRVPGARLVTLGGLRHTSPITDAGPVAAAILDAIAAAGIPFNLEVSQ
jgi:pimeloyl-ACP methyl ester carboxylesterase